MYLDSLTEMAKRFHVLDHTNYARWIPVHLRDMAEPTSRRPDIARQLKAENFTAQNTKKVFSSISN